MAKPQSGQAATAEPETVETPAVPETLDDEAVKSLTVEQIKGLTIYQLIGLDGRHDLLTAEQSEALAETLAERVKSTTKELRQTARQKSREEQEKGWRDYLATLAPQVIQTAEAETRKRVEYVSIRIYRNGDTITYKESTKSRGFREGEMYFTASQDAPAQAAD